MYFYGSLDSKDNMKLREVFVFFVIHTMKTNEEMTSFISILNIKKLFCYNRLYDDGINVIRTLERILKYVGC